MDACLQLSDARTCLLRPAAGSDVTLTTCRSAATECSVRGISHVMEPTGSASLATVTTSPALRLVCAAYTSLFYSVFRYHALNDRQASS